MIKIRKCQEIYQTLKKNHSESRTAGDSDIKAIFYKSSAREIEADLYTMKLNGEISHNEYLYIWGMICQDALHFGGKDFYRV